MTMKSMPSSSSPKSVMSTMFGWRMALTARASVKKREVTSSLAATSRFRTLIAARRPITVCSAK